MKVDQENSPKKKHQHLHEMLDRFLAERRESKGGWAEFPDEDMKLFAEFLCGLREAKFEPDPDGDYPLEFVLVNRTVHQGYFYRPVPYVRSSTDNRLLSALRIAEANLGIAKWQLEMLLRYVEVRLTAEGWQQDL